MFVMSCGQVCGDSHFHTYGNIQIYTCGNACSDSCDYICNHPLTVLSIHVYYVNNG